jgi:hypothetical protein
MNIVFGGVLAVGIAASALFLSRHGLPETERAAIAAPIDAAAMAPDHETFRLSGPGGRGACGLTRIRDDLSGRSTVEISADCERLLAGLSRAEFWREQPDGSVALDDASGRTLVQFAGADGAGYESYKPALPPLSLVRGN